MQVEEGVLRLGKAATSFLPSPGIIHSNDIRTNSQNPAVMSSRDSNEAHMKQKRARSQLSCTACRHGKLRCNRAAPCDQCIKRSKESACSYLPPAAKARAPQDVKGRIQHLEQLVVDLMNSRSSDGTGTTTNSGRSNSTAASIGDLPTTSRSDFSRSDTQSSSEAEKAQNRVTPPYSEDNSPARQHLPEAQVESLGHLRISKEGTRYVAGVHRAQACSCQMVVHSEHRNVSTILQSRPGSSNLPSKPCYYLRKDALTTKVLHI